jgi:peptide/nickel transport system ATP-binding protein
MYAGRIVESGTVDEVLDQPLHPYTRGLLESVPGRHEPGRPLPQIPGMAPAPLQTIEGCSFRPRCARASEACRVPPTVACVAARRVRCVHPLT